MALSSPNDQRRKRHTTKITRPLLYDKSIEQWNEILKEAIQKCLFRDPVLSDYAFFHKENIHKPCTRFGHKCRLFWKDYELGIVENIGGKLKFTASE